MTYKHFDSCQNMKVLVKYVMNTAPPLLVVAVEALHHHIRRYRSAFIVSYP